MRWLVVAVAVVLAGACSGQSLARQHEATACKLLHSALAPGKFDQTFMVAARIEAGKASESNRNLLPFLANVSSLETAVRLAGPGSEQQAAVWLANLQTQCSKDVKVNLGVGA